MQPVRFGDLSSISAMAQAHSTNTGYAVRGAIRQMALPKDRMLDYYFRDFFMTVVTAYVFELCFRVIESLYTAPLIAKNLGLNKLARLYKKEHPDIALKNHRMMPEALMKRFMGSLIRSQSNPLIPELLERELNPGKLQDLLKGADSESLVKQTSRLLGNGPELQKYTGKAERNAKLIADAETLTKQVCRRMDYQQYLQKYAGKSADEIKQVMAAMGKAEGEFSELMKAVKKPREKQWMGPAKAVLSKIEDTELRKLVVDGLRSKQAMSLIKRAQSSSWVPKFFLTLVANIAYFGVVGNWFDFNVLQPWQKKAAQERGGTVQELIAPAYLSLIPGIAAFGTLMSKVGDKLPIVKNWGHAGRFGWSGLVGLGVYSLATVMLVKNKLARLRKEKPVNNSPVIPVTELSMATTRPKVNRFQASLPSPVSSSQRNYRPSYLR